MFCENMWGHIETKWYEANTPEQGILGTVSLHRNIPCIHRAHTVLYRSLTVHSPCTHRASPFIYRARWAYKNYSPCTHRASPFTHRALTVHSPFFAVHSPCMHRTLTVLHRSLPCIYRANLLKKMRYNSRFCLHFFVYNNYFIIKYSYALIIFENTFYIKLLPSWLSFSLKLFNFISLKVNIYIYQNIPSMTYFPLNWSYFLLFGYGFSTKISRLSSSVSSTLSTKPFPNKLN